MANKSNPIKKIRSASIKTLSLAMVVLCLYLTSACQPTPSKPAVIQKDNFEDLVKITAQPVSSEEPQPTTSTDTSAPTDKEHITWKNEMSKNYPNGCSTKTVINVDAYIDIEQRKSSVFLVETKDYDIDFAKRAVDYFIGDKYYDGIYIKEDLQLKILPLKQAIQNMKEDQYGSKQGAESRLHRFEWQYGKAPENNSPGKITFSKEWYHPIVNEYIKYMCVKGYPYSGAVSELYIGNGGKANTNFYYAVQDGRRWYDITTIQYEYSGTPARGMVISYEAAKSIAEEAISHLYGEKMVYIQTDLCKARVVDEKMKIARSLQLDDTCPQCYVFTFTPVYGGIPQLYAPEARNEDDAQNDEGAIYEQK